MTTIFYDDPELVIGLNRTIICVYPNDNQIFKTIELPERLTVEVSSEEARKSGEEEKPTTLAVEPLRIQQVCFSPDRQLMAVTTSGQKCLLIYKCWLVNTQLVSTRTLARTSSSVTFSSDSKSVLVTDKTGDCYLYDCVNMDSPPKLLLGHLSIVNDILWSENQKHIITCDRDDKIRVTHFPDTFDIHGYCLGHREFVSGLKFLSTNTIASISGDKTLRIWDYESCKQLAKVELPGAAIRFDIHKIDDFKYETAILHQLDNCVSMYSLEKDENGAWSSKELGVYKFKNLNACNVCLTNDRLFVTGAENEKFRMELLPIPSALPPPVGWLDMVNDMFKEYIWTPEDVSSWFKKRYDNVSDYLERKKRRIEEKQK